MSLQEIVSLAILGKYGRAVQEQFLDSFDDFSKIEEQNHSALQNVYVVVHDIVYCGKLTQEGKSIFEPYLLALRNYFNSEQ